MSESSEGQDNSPGVFSLSLDFEEDVEQEIEAFVRFKRLRDYDKAHELFQKTLSPHVGFFPVAAEYADLLLEQGKYKMLSDFLDIQIEYMEMIFEDEELELFRIMRSLVRIHTKGALRPALAQAQKTWKFLYIRRENISESHEDFPSDIQIHIFEIYIAIIIFAFRTSNWVSMEDMKYPWSFLNVRQGSEISGFVQWYEILSRNGDLWSASRVLHILLKCFPNFPPVDAGILFKDHCYGGDLTGQTFSLLNEMRQMIAFNACLDRAEALAEIATITPGKLRPPDEHDEPKYSSGQVWESLHTVACRYLELASTCKLIISRNKGDDTHWRRLETMQMKLDILYELFSGRSLENKQRPSKYIVSRDPETFFSGIVLSIYHSNSPLSFESDELIHFQLHEQGDLIGLIRTWALLSSRLDYSSLSTQSSLFRRLDGIIARRQGPDNRYDDHVHCLLHHLLQLLHPISQLDERFTKPIHLDQVVESGSEEFDVPICLSTLLRTQDLDVVQSNLFLMKKIEGHLANTKAFDLDGYGASLSTLKTGSRVPEPENTRISMRALLGITPSTAEPRTRLRKSMKRRIVDMKARDISRTNESSSDISHLQSHDVSQSSNQTCATSLSGVADSSNIQTHASQKKHQSTSPPQSFLPAPDDESRYAEKIKELALDKLSGPINAMMKTQEISQRFYQSIKKRVGKHDKIDKPPIVHIPDTSPENSIIAFEDFMERRMVRPRAAGSFDSIRHG